METTRKYPRTSREAFPEERAEWLERPERSHVPRIARLIIVGAFLILTLWSLFA